MRACLALFGALAAASLWLLGDGVAGWLYAIIYLVAILPGLRMGFALFGRTHAGGWIAGALIGYTIANLAAWGAIELHLATAWGFAAVAAVVALVVWVLLAPIHAPLVRLPQWTRASATSLLLILILTLIVAVPPLAKVGWRDDEGNRYYRAYFTADFVWHAAMTAELKKFDLPPRNPYLKNRDIHYYWTYFLLPAAIAGTGPVLVRDVELCLKLNALLTGLLLMSTLFLATWVVVPRAGPAGIAVALALVASSAEGVSAIAGLLYTDQPLSELKNVNIDAVSNWVLGGYRIDGLQRSIWYVPQHSMAYALGLLAIIGVTAADGLERRATAFLMGCTLGCSTLYSPLVGGLFAAAYGIALLVRAWRQRRLLSAMLTHAIVIIPVAAAILWQMANRMIAGAGGALEFGFARQSLHHPVLALVVSLGPMLLFAAAGFWPSARRPFEQFTAYAAVAAVSLAAMYLVRLSVDVSWVGFRTGHMLVLVLPAFGARFLAGAEETGRRKLAVALVLAVLVGGAPTVVIDEFNAQDIRNHEISPGDFPFTVVVYRRQQAAFDWIRANTPTDAIVQMDPVPRGRSTWSLVPSWAERRMAAGMPISLLHIADYDVQSQLAHSMYTQTDPEAAWRIAKQLGIDYIYEDDVERQAPGAEAFGNAPSRFELVFHDGDVEVYRVK